MNPEPVVLINAFEVPDGQDEGFLAAWERARAFLATQAPAATPTTVPPIRVTESM